MTPAAPAPSWAGGGRAKARLDGRGHAWVSVLREVGVPVDADRWADLLRRLPPSLTEERRRALQAYGPAVLAAARLSPDGRVRAGRWQRRPSGRWYAHDPPLQLITGAMRPAIRAEPGFVFIDADFDKCHLWIAAHLSGDADLAGLLQSGCDLHAEMGRVAAPALHPGAARKVGKTCNFLLVNGGSAQGLRDALAGAGVPLTLDQAHDIHRRWWSRFPALHRWLFSIVADEAWVRDGQPLDPDQLTRRHLSTKAKRESRMDRWRRRISLQLQSRESAILAWMMRLLVQAAIASGGDPIRPTDWAVRPVLAMHDGFVIEVREDWLETVRSWLPGAAAQACWEARLPVIPLTIDTRKSWGTLEVL